MATSRGAEDPRIEPASPETAPLAVEQEWLKSFFADRPGSVEFFQAVRLLGRLGHGLMPPGAFPKHPDQEVVRFGANPAYWFPPSQIHSLEWIESDSEKFTWKPPMLRVNFMGLVGPMGLMPFAWQDLVLERLRARDRTLLEFFDLFHHRTISLFYQAWEKYRFWVSYERDRKDRMSRYLMDFIGLGTPGLESRQSVPDTSLIFYSGLLSLQPRSALALEQLLSDYFDVPIEVDEFSGSWYPLAPEDICRFADPPTEAEQLGFGVVVGDAVWNRASCAKIAVGPLALNDYINFLPGGNAHEPLASLTRFFTQGEIIFEVQLILSRDHVPQCQLGMDSSAPPRLGWLTWMNTSKTRGQDPGDTVFLMN
ncbi:MAG: type VI secretion system baseplate subunit TssG [Bryobacter sp.]|jgi:type VI secretion system protein ImpH|nr:type VI secretion system baseplate subunit TssG [Bryobacter sp. CoA8 C33]